MPKKQNKDISTIVAEKLGLKLEEYARLLEEDIHVYHTEDGKHELTVCLDVGYVSVISTDDKHERRDYNIDAVLTEIDGVERPDWQQRVIDEERELAARLDKLTRFIETEAFNNLPSVEREDLVTQQKHMGYYQQVLRSRIARFNT